MNAQSPQPASHSQKPIVISSLTAKGSLTKTAGMRNLFGFSRQLLARMFNQELGHRRDYYSVFGYDRQITLEMMMEMYHRGGVAQRIIHAYPDAIWATPPEIYQDVTANDAWTRRWNEITTNTNYWEAVYRADKLSRLGRYSIILVGTDRPNLESPLREAREVLYFQPYSEVSAKISAWNNDTTSPRFGQPEMYTIYPDLANQDHRSGSIASGDSALPSRGSFRVHASRVIHVAQGVMEDDVFGTPMYGAVWNYLLDLMKVVGGSAESYWLTANRGMQVDIDKEADLSEDDAAALSAEVEEYEHQLRRVMRTRGVTIKDLGSKVADPRGPYTTIVQLISGTSRIPQRILLGAEAGHLASTQDKGNWAEQVENERALSSEPRILRPTLQCLMGGGLLPAATKDIVSNWPDAYRSSPAERADIGSKIALAANNLGLMAKNMTPQPQPPPGAGGFGGANQPGAPQRAPATPGGKGPRTQADPVPESEADPDKQKPLLSREEMRGILGFSTDNRILEDSPLSESSSRRILMRARDVTPS